MGRGREYARGLVRHLLARGHLEHTKLSGWQQITWGRGEVGD